MAVADHECYSLLDMYDNTSKEQEEYGEQEEAEEGEEEAEDLPDYESGGDGFEIDEHPRKLTANVQISEWKQEGILS